MSSIRMKRGALLAALLGAASMAARAEGPKGEGDDRKGEESRSSQITQGKGGVPEHATVHGSKRAGPSGSSGPAGPGIELGQADGMAGGRTDRGPKGAVGIADSHTTTKESNARANAADQKRKRTNAAPQRADVEGGGKGTHDVNYAEPLGEEGKRIPAKGATHGRAQGKIEQPGGSGPEGISGHDTGGDKGPAPAPGK